MNFEEAVRALHDLAWEPVAVTVARRDKDPDAPVLMLAGFGGVLHPGIDPAEIGWSGAAAGTDEDQLFVVGEPAEPFSYFLLRDSLTVVAEWDPVTEPAMLVIDIAGVTIALQFLREDFQVPE